MYIQVPKSMMDPRSHMLTLLTVERATQLGLRIWMSSGRARRSRVYLTSGTGEPPENARSNEARSALGKSETAM
jgi:hypothetical protein